ncbi:MAG: protein jag [SAR202 cluster bacterium]|nr:protein jag [SAR202 cluster bacterium]MQG13171.1 protein jag [SAR202 cluster bacterium]MQG41787.1 protein jag [SAR202 cluster bacterium]MQG61156.1 protein jag [SAR202 cluster bacterium]|tara:strand:+ start:43 stop:756 length:714 start_codon:yes stop_codon:yes gene_type:complete
MIQKRRPDKMEEATEIIMSARTVDEAIELGLKELDADRDEAEVEILSRGKAGFLGIGAEVARVRVTRISAGRNAAGMPTTGEGETTAAGVATAAVGRILEAAGVNVTRTLRAANDPESGGPIIDLAGEDSGLLIGRRGQTLQALQFLVNLIVRKQFEGVRVVLDVENYRQRREFQLRDMATKVAARVTQTNRSITLEPMPPADRRIIHTSLTDNPDVSTESTGEGEGRKVTIMPKRD